MDRDDYKTVNTPRTVPKAGHGDIMMTLVVYTSQANSTADPGPIGDNKWSCIPGVSGR